MRRHLLNGRVRTSTVVLTLVFLLVLVTYLLVRPDPKAIADTGPATRRTPAATPSKSFSPPPSPTASPSPSRTVSRPPSEPVSPPAASAGPDSASPSPRAPRNSADPNQSPAR